eukprot:TRINITY_DN4340_c0_g3_i1.p1 TRINITY_DN4340_c0_g3~~TRINITY_DN4340_c0_g3_i1.p1  ORF type:complete len:870 (-),score=204.03 TRINITY_DN4340_c0_g3_i1:78-2687(-)
MALTFAALPPGQWVPVSTPTVLTRPRRGGCDHEYELPKRSRAQQAGASTTNWAAPCVAVGLGALGAGSRLAGRASGSACSCGRPGRRRWRRDGGGLLRLAATSSSGEASLATPSPGDIEEIEAAGPSTMALADDASPLAVPEVDPDEDAASVIKAATEAGVLTQQKSRQKGFNPNVLRASDGQVIGGDGAEAPGAKELLEWMKKRGCKGVHNILIRSGGGVVLRQTAPTVPSGEPVLTLPMTAWLAPKEGDRGSPASLAWTLLQELWAGESSEYEPLVSWLRRINIEHHPILWDEVEVNWLQPSPEAFEEVNKTRADAAERVETLLGKARQLKADGGQVSLPDNLAADEEALKEEIKWALALVQAWGILIEDPVTHEEVVHLCPLLTDVRNTSGTSCSVDFGESAEGPELLAQKKLRPGEELTQRCMPDGSSAAFLAEMGLVPGAEQPGVPKDTDLIEMNSNRRVLLQIPAITIDMFPSEAHIKPKLRLLSEYASLDLAAPRPETAPPDRICIRLPEEAVETGRLLPTARFLMSQVTVTGLSLDLDQECSMLFNEFFRHCKLERYPEVEDKYQGMFSVERSGDVEVMARSLVADWCTARINEYTTAIELTAQETGLPTGTRNGIISFGVGHTVMAYFKAKRKDGTTAKSRTPRQAKVCSVNEEDMTVRLEFMGNKRKHEVPADWIVEAQPTAVAGLLSSGVTPTRIKRAKLAITLLRTERAVLFYMYDAFALVAKTIDGLVKKARRLRENGNDVEADKCQAVIEDFLAKEIEGIDDEKAEALLPTKLEQLPNLPDENGVVAPRDSDLPRWGLPQVKTDGMLGDLEPEPLPDGQWLVDAARLGEEEDLSDAALPGATPAALEESATAPSS